MSDSIRPDDSSSAEAVPRVAAVIDIGATSIRLAIAEIFSDGGVRPLDTLVQSVDLGREVFSVRRISRKSIERSVEILKRYQRILKEYGITQGSQVRAVATTAVREAENRLAFTDRIFVATGLNVEPIDEQEVNRITYVGVYPHLETRKELSQGETLVVEVGGGNTELLVVRGGNVLASQSLRLGSLRLTQTLSQLSSDRDQQRSFLENHILRALTQVNEFIHDEKQIHVVALGGDIRFAATLLQDTWDEKSLSQISVSKLAELSDRVLNCTDDELVKEFSISYVEAATLAPALLVYRLLAQHLSLSSMFVCDTNLRDGLFHDMAMGGSWSDEFRNQIIRSAISLGRKFGFDESHARNVAELCRSLFVQLASEHGMETRYEVILFVAALLHEIGLVVNARSNMNLFFIMNKFINLCQSPKYVILQE